MKVAFMATAARLSETYLLDAECMLQLVGGNTGNIAFINAIASHLNCEVNRVSWDASPDQLRQAGDIVVIACANQLGVHTDLSKSANNLDKANLPIIALGLGAQADSQDRVVELREGTLRWAQVLAAHAPVAGPNIGVRGEYTLHQLEYLGLGKSAVIIGCPSNLTNLTSDYPASIALQSGTDVHFVAAAMGHPFTPALAPIERQILDLVDQTDGTCVVQHGASMVALAMCEFDNIDPPLLERTRRYFRPNLTLDQFKHWCRRRTLVFGDADAWMSWLKRYDFVIGPRFHGVMLALQAGVPAGCVAHDSRTLEMCQTMAVPVRMYDTLSEPLTTGNLKQEFPFDANLYRKTRATLARNYVSLLEAGGISFDKRLEDVARTSSAVTAKATA